MKPISSRCSRGLQQILDYESNLRRYTLKMTFICSEPVLDGVYTRVVGLAGVDPLLRFGWSRGSRRANSFLNKFLAPGG